MDKNNVIYENSIERAIQVVCKKCEQSYISLLKEVETVGHMADYFGYKGKKRQLFFDEVFNRLKRRINIIVLQNYRCYLVDKSTNAITHFLCSVNITDDDECLSQYVIDENGNRVQLIYFFNLIGGRK